MLESYAVVAARDSPPRWSLPARHSRENIYSLECWGLGAACLSKEPSDLEVETSTNDDLDCTTRFEANLDDDDAMHSEDAALVDLHNAWLHRRRHLPEAEECEIMQMNANLSGWWRRSFDAEDEKEPEKNDEQGVQIALTVGCRLVFRLDIYDYKSFHKCAQHPPMSWGMLHWKQHAATLKYFEWVQQHRDESDHDEDLLISDKGTEVPTYLQTESGACRWNSHQNCHWYWQEMVTQIDDQIIRYGLTDMQFVFKGAVIEACTVGATGGFFLYRGNNTAVRLVPNFHKNQIWATEYTSRGTEIKNSSRLMQFDLRKMQ